jgi:uroporphyrinogen decarboxylase
MGAPIEQLPNFQPDYRQLDTVIRRAGEPDYVPLVEIFADPEIMAAALGGTARQMFPRYEAWQQDLLFRIEYSRRIGQDYACAPIDGAGFSYRRVHVPDTAALSRGLREWVDESQGPVPNRRAFGEFAWPVEPCSTRQIDFVAENLPAGMGLSSFTGGIFEWTTWLMGYESLALALYDDPQLVDDVLERVGQRMLDGYGKAAAHPAVRALWMGDDMGFKTATLIGANHLRELFFPWHRRIAQLAHQAGKCFLLHSCGNIDQVMDDLIDRVGIDAKHSFEDVIMPVAQFKACYGHRIAVLGGADVDFLTRATPAQVRTYCRQILRECAPGGGFAMGTGNSVANYIPLENYLALVDELARFNGRA